MSSEIHAIYKVEMVVQAEDETGSIVAVTSFPDFKPPPQALSSLNKSQFPDEVLSLFQELHLSLSPGNPGNLYV